MQFSLLKRLLSYTKVYSIYLIGALFCAIGYVICTLLGPVLIGETIDYMIGPGQVEFSIILKTLILLGIVIGIGAVLQWLMTLCTNIVSYKTVKALRIETFRKLNKVPLKYIDGHAHGDIMSRIVNDIDQVSDGLIQGFSQLFTGIITILGTLIFMFSINGVISLVVVLITPLSLFVASFIAKRSYSMFREQAKVKGELSGYIEEMVGNQKIVKTFGYEERAIKHFEGVNEELYNCGVKAQFYSSITNPCTRFVNGVVYAAVGIIGAISAIYGRLSIGQLSCFLAYANQYTKPFNEISGVITELQSAFASVKRIFEILDEEEEIQEEIAIDRLEECKGNVVLDNVAFSYSKDKKLIENLNLVAKPGDKIAIVGPTGCGKTTLINLLMRFYDVDEGSIQIEGQDIKTMNRQYVRSLYGMVLQETWLFAGTIRENIAYGKEDATEEEVIAAAKQAYAHSFIKRLPQGYNTLITEDGNNISEGQKQLLCIARIMLTKPPMLILDEATSRIDTRTEMYIQKAFTKIMEGRTHFVVAHRLSTIEEADTIIVMNKGKIIEQGTHKELLEEKGFYAELYNSQFAKEE